MIKKRVLSGVQTTGNLHLGNYLGAIRNWVSLQDSHECFYMLADLHAITVFQNPADLTRNTREMAAALIACGIDPKRAVIFPQSAVPMHTELAWILFCHTPLGWLNRMTQFKEKASIEDAGQAKGILKNKDEKTNSLLAETQRQLAEFNNLSDDSKVSADGNLFLDGISKTLKLIEEEYAFDQKNKTTIDKEITKRTESAKLGLYSYPVLQTADILLYHAQCVPVGEDQKQHLELARDIAGAFNRAYGEAFFPLPEPLILPAAARIMSLNDGTRKMSKSEESDYSRINLTDDADAIATKFKKAQTDSDPTLTFDKQNRPSVANLISIYAALAETTPQQVVEQFAALKTGQFKTQLAELAVEKLSPITARMRELMSDTDALDAILRDGAERARAVAMPILAEVKKRVGFFVG